MNALFDYGYRKARQGYPWRKFPPVLAGVEQAQASPPAADVARAGSPAALPAPAPVRRAR
jgi:hypothetical protein